MMDINNCKFSGWLECALQDLYRLPVEKIALCAVLEDGSTLTTYFNCEEQDKAIMAHTISNDAMIDTIVNNIDVIRNALEQED